MPTAQDVWREHAPHVLAALLRRGADLGSAEDAVQEALLAAAVQWPVEGAPRDPRAWLVTVARRRLVDAHRSDAARERRELVAAHRDGLDRPGPAAGTDEGEAADDDSLVVLLLCCHPALPLPARVALTLRAVGGLTTAQIARAFGVPEATMAQRVTRAKARLREAGVPFAAPTAAELPARLTAAMHVLYLVFTEGHTSTSGPGLYDVSLASEAIRLTRELHRRVPGVGEVSGLLALLLLTDARRAARIGPDGALVPLAEQDRGRWDRALIAEGVALLEAALPVGPVGPYQLQAAIAAVHAEAGSAEATDWRQIAALYAMLDRVAPSPAVTLNRAVAVAMVEGPAAGLRLLGSLPPAGRDHRPDAVRGHLLELQGDVEGARAAYLAAAGATTSLPEQRYLRRRAVALGKT
jgi:RNA polymerase sigma factor (sigma-70 family)